jgi:hypothetical protein
MNPPGLRVPSGDENSHPMDFKVADWNQIHMIASGHTFTQFINGRLMSMLIDEDSTKFKPKGLIGLQCAGSGTMRITFRNLWLRTM